MATKNTASKKTAPKTTAPLSPTHFFQTGFWLENLYACLVLTGVVFLLYGLTISFGYLQDDQIYIWDNAFVQKGFAGLAEIFGNDSLLGFYKDPKIMLEGGRYRPLPLATFAMEIGLFGKESAWAGHFMNVLWYVLCTLLLFRILLALFPRQEGASWYQGIAFWATVLFMLHPLHVEVVSNIKSRDEIMAMVGSLGALWAVMKYFDTQTDRYRWMAAGFFLLGLLSKENTVTFLAVIPLTIWVFSHVSLGRAVNAVLPLLGSLGLFLLMRMVALQKLGTHPDELVLNPFFGMNGMERLATIFLALGWNLKLLFVPHPLTIDYYPYHVPKVTWADWRPLVSLAIYAGLGWWAFKTLRKEKSGQQGNWSVPAYSVLYFLFTISIVSNLFVRTSTFMNERYLYLPSVAFCLAAAWFGVKKLPELLGNRQVWPGYAVLGIVAALFAVRTWTRIPDWGGDGSRLVESAIQVSGNSYRANYYYANLLYEKQYKPLEKATDQASVAQRTAILTEIEPYLNKSLQINPGYRLAAPMKVQLAVIRYNQDKNLEKLLRDLEQLIQNQPANGDMLVMVLDVLKSLKGADPNIYNFFCHRVGYNFYFVKMQDPNGAIEFLNLALANYAQDRNTIQDLIQVYTAMGDQAKVQELQQRLRM
ncbi:MAG TPA: hypothetical protein VK168_07770 [Saprospiraceae bacterium]|nr:hypothetical protein [Saprospiraceae bacterium]